MIDRCSNQASLLLVGTEGTLGYSSRETCSDCPVPCYYRNHGQHLKWELKSDEKPGKNLDVENIPWCTQFLRSYFIHKAAWPWTNLKVPKGHTRSMSISSEILMWKTSLKFNMIQAIYKELSHSQDAARHCLLRQWQYPSNLRGGGVKRCLLSETCNERLTSINRPLLHEQSYIYISISDESSPVI